MAISIDDSGALTQTSMRSMMNPAGLTYYALTTKNAWGPLGWRRDQWGATDSYLDKILKITKRNLETARLSKIGSQPAI